MKTATVSHEAACWSVSIPCEIAMPDPVPNLGPVVGIDMGIAKPMALHRAGDPASANYGQGK
jgi:transposase